MTKVEIHRTPSEDEQSAMLKETESARRFDYELTQKAANGDLAAFEQIYWRYHRLVYSLCLRMTKKPEDAEDVAQNVFVKLSRKIGSFKGEANFSSWLYRFTFNEVLMHFRRVKTRREKLADDEEMPEPVVAGTEKADAMSIFDRIALKQTLAQLPAGYKTVFILYDVAGYEHHEIAQLLGFTAGTSKSQLDKARKKLRQLLLDGKSKLDGCTKKFPARASLKQKL